MRLATSKDIELLVRHRHMMFEEMSSPSKEAARTADESYRTWALEMMKRGLFHGYIVTTREGRPAASGCVWLREIQPSPDRPTVMVPYVMSVYTSPEFRRSGLASMIMEEAAEWARREGFHKIVLHASSVGRKVYSRLGWKRTWEMELRFDRPAGRARPSRRTARRPSKRSRGAT
jgi:GNAT superfamily N-acetyltransferase